MSNSDTKFTASNYGIETTARQEWEIVTTEAYPTSCTAEYRRKSEHHKRKLHKLRYASDCSSLTIYLINTRSLLTLAYLSELMELKCVKPVIVQGQPGLGLSKAEVKAVTLYTGPNYMLYNAAMRQGLTDKVYKDLQGNKYPNTIHALVSAVLKLQRKNVTMPENLTLYRGLGCALLPPVYTQTHTNTCKHPHTYTHTYTHKHTHTHTHAHTHTHRRSSTPLSRTLGSRGSRSLASCPQHATKASPPTTPRSRRATPWRLFCRVK